jgi:hypothetical protein
MVMHKNLHLLCLRADAYHWGIMGATCWQSNHQHLCGHGEIHPSEICHEDGEFFDKEGVLTLDDAERLGRWVS